MKGPVQNVISICSFVAVLLPLEVLSKPAPQDDDNLVTIELLSEDSNPDVLVRREADSNLPDRLSFMVSTTNGEVTLRMKRSKLLSTVTSHSDVSRPFSNDVAVYTDVTNGASIIVRRDESQYNLHGSFLHGETEWYLEPSDRRRRDSGRKSHTLLRGRPNAEIISFAGDTVLDDQPHVEILSLEERDRYRLQRLATLQGETTNNTRRELKLLDRQPEREITVKTKRTTVEHVIELVFVVDHADYKKWVDYKGAFNAINEMTIWYTYIAEGIDIRYKTISDPDIQLSTRVILLKILTSDGEDDFIEDLITSGTFNPDDGVLAFRAWYQDPVNGIPNADHYMYFTGFDIKHVIGVAILDAACTASAVSISENDFTALVAVVAAHELAHSFSSDHDHEISGCHQDKGNIMAPVVTVPVATGNRGNPWRFSSCSVASIKAYLSGVTCTEPQNTGTTDRLPAPSGDDRAGIAQGRDEQCRNFFKSNASSFCSGWSGGENSMCGGMLCTVPDSPSECIAIIPLEYTACGNGKWCRTGLCLDEDEEPTDPPPIQPGPQTIFDCISYLLGRDFKGLLICFADVFFG
ncbi:hypothetical protein RRG08_011090 [Elysia crispata]|uniref:Peptidase M12B domain-containing protein n=1 Tax=Elysia crispata TaxID=231223 RepID=A0AAE0Z958_9GAST|nr:hypothetical protein RRG08_011090 [Elysia crispata]